MLSSNQRAIDGLLFARRIVARLRSEEFQATFSTEGVMSEAQDNDKEGSGKSSEHLQQPYQDGRLHRH